VVVVHDLRVPLAKRTREMLVVSGNVVHVEVAVVVRGRCISARGGACRLRGFGDALSGMGSRMYQLETRVHAVGIVEDAEDDVVMEEAEGLGIGEGVELVNGFRPVAARRLFSLAWRPPSIHTMARPSSESAWASASVKFFCAG